MPDDNLNVVTWEFQLALEFLQAFDSTGSTGFQLGGDGEEEGGDGEGKKASAVLPIQAQNGPRRLGDFSRIYEALGIEELPASSSSSLETTSEYLPVDNRPSSPSSLSEPAEDFDDFVDRYKHREKGVRWNDGVHDGIDGETKDISESRVDGGSRDGLVGYVDSSSLGHTPSIFSNTPTREDTAGLPFDFDINTDQLIIRPFQLQTPEKQRTRLRKTLRKRFPESRSSLAEARFIKSVSGTGAGAVSDSRGVHVFVDFSNVIIGFYNILKTARGLHEKAYVRQPPFSYHSFALALERGRSVARRVLVGSTSKSLYSQTGPQRVAKHFSDAEACGYEMNILDRVSKLRPVTPVRRKKNGTGNGYATVTSGDESTAFLELKRPVMAEQGVDELLQMKILESIIDTATPTTIVLASGDAAEAEYSGGFLKTVQRALLKGWKVEVVAWREGLSGEYRNKDFLRKWEGRFRIIELDDFAEYFLAVYI